MSECPPTTVERAAKVQEVILRARRTCNSFLLCPEASHSRGAQTPCDSILHQCAHFP
jgi:hypothetical protein